MARTSGFHRAGMSELTGRQKQVLELVARGRTNAQIGDALGIGYETVKMHVGDILGRLGVDTREEAAEAWRRERASGTRLRQALGWVSPALGGRLVYAAASLVVVGVGVVAVLAMSREQDRTGDDRAPADRPLAGSFPTATAERTSTTVRAVQQVPTGTPPPPTPTTTPETDGCRIVRGQPGPIRFCDRSGELWLQWPGDDATEYEIAVEDADDRGGNPPAPSQLIDWGSAAPGAATEYRFTAGVLPTWDTASQCFTPIGIHRVSVRAKGGDIIGGVTFSGCEVRSLSPTGCIMADESKEGAAPMSRAAFVAGKPRCVSWHDERADETGFRIQLHYFNSNETFVFEAPPNTTEFVFPADATTPTDGSEVSIGRKDWAWSVTAILANGTEIVLGGGSVIVM